MADERVVTQLVVEGARQFISDFAQAGLAVNELTARLASTERIRTPQLAPQIDQITQALQRSAKSALEFSSALGQITPKAQQVINTEKALQQTIRDRINAQNQLTRTIVDSTGQTKLAVQREVEAAKKAVDELAARIRANRAQIAADVARQAAPSAFDPRQALFNARVQNIRNPSGQALVDQLRQQAIESDRVAQASARKTGAIKQQGDVEGEAQRKGITYLSVLSAIHAASFLASNRTFTLVGSFATLGLAFSRLGPLAAIAGLSLGGLLTVFNILTTTAERLQQAFITTASTLGGLAVVASTAVAAAGTAGVKIAADVETQLAGLRAFGGATTEQLRQASSQATELALRFGVSSKSVVEAASLFARAGGTVQEALDGATEAIIKLQVASQGELTAAQAAVAVSAGLKQFALTGAEAARVADVLAGAAQASALSFTGVVQAFVQAAPGAVTLGVSLEDLGAVIALLGDRLIKGTITGTAFKQELLDLVNPSEKAKAKLSELGISIKTAEGSIRPLIDILDDLNKALGDQAVETGKITEAARAEAIAVLFQSRAGLAGAITARAGAQGLRDYREELEKVTASGIVDVLLLPLNKQLERLVVVIQEVGRAFGSPLLEPIRAAVVAAINFATGLIEPAKLAGQAIAVVLTDQGFGALQQKISELTGNPQLAIFLQLIVNSFRNVRDVIVSTIVPAIQEFIGTLVEVGSESGRLTDLVTAFKSIDRAIQIVGVVIATLIKQFGLLLVSIIHNEGQGKELRNTLSSLATVLVTNLVTGLALFAGSMTVGVKLLEGFGKIIRENILPNVEGFANAIVFLADLLLQAKEPFIAPFRALAAQVEFARAIIEGAGIEDALKRATEASKTAFAPFATERAALGALKETARAIANVAKTTRAAIDDVTSILDGANASVDRTIALFDKLGGEIPDGLANLQAALDEILRRITSPEGTGGAPPEVDTKGIERAKERILEAGRDLVRRLENLNEDVANRVTNIQDRALERIGDIFEKADRNLEKLTRDTKERIDDLNEAFELRIEEKGLREGLQRGNEQRLRSKQAEVDAEELLENNLLDSVRLIRSRATEDAQRSFDLIAQAAERSFSRSQAAAERAFGHIQQDQDRAFQLTQDLEERQLSNRLKAEAEARRFAQELQGATTPQERQRVSERATQARADAQFAERQQAQLDALRKRQDTQRVAFQRQQEQAQVAFRLQQEDRLLAFKLKAERAAIAERRRVEDVERNVREREDEQKLFNDIFRADILAGLRESNARRLQKLQDDFDEQNHQKQLRRIEREAEERRQEITTESARQVGEVLDQVVQQLIEQRQQVEKTLRGINQSFIDLVENLPADVKQGVAGDIIRIGQLLEQGAAGARTEFDKLEESVLAVVEARRLIGSLGAGLGARAPTGAPVAPTVPTQVTTQTTTRLVLTPDIDARLTNVIVGALSIAAARDIIPAQDIDIVIQQAPVDVQAAIRRVLQGV